MEWNPIDYAENSSAQLAWARELIARLNLSGNESVLDVGCGDGGVTSELSRNLPEGLVLGIDSSAAFVEHASQRYGSKAYPNLSFKQMDARRLISDRSFDIVFSNAALHWVDDHPAFLAGAARLLKPSGTLIVSCGGEGNAAGIVNAMDEVIYRKDWARYFSEFDFPYYFYSTTDYESWLPAAGFTATRLELVEKDMVHPGREGLAGWIRTTWIPYTQHVPARIRDRFVSEFLDAYLARHPLDGAGQSHVRMIRLECEARRFASLE